MLKIDVKKTSKEMLYALLSQEAGKTITDKDVTFSKITALANPDYDANTSVELASVAGSSIVKPGGTDPLVRKLTRRTLAEVATAVGANLNLDDDVERYTTASYVVNKVNTLLGTVLTDEEMTIDSGTVVDNKRDVTVTMKPEAHIAFYGSMIIKVTDSINRQATLEEQFPNEIMKGFDAPVPPAVN